MRKLLTLIFNQNFSREVFTNFPQIISNSLIYGPAIWEIGRRQGGDAYKFRKSFT
jgi:hypothetical protein